jgi:hypothetical protein
LSATILIVFTRASFSSTEEAVHMLMAFRKFWVKEVHPTQLFAFFLKQMLITLL